jgi:tRNA pseudouridine13 synthase
MTLNPMQDTPLLTGDIAGIGGRIKVEPEDFEVEEIPAYQPCGSGEFLYLWVEKRGLGAEYFLRQLGQRLGVSSREIGTAGMKDRHAVTRQMVSVPATAEPRLAQAEGDGIRILNVSRHGNKLRPGHLHGNRFRILIRDVAGDVSPTLTQLTERIRQTGLPNFYGPQRFGRDGETGRMGLALLHGEPVRVRNPFLRKLALSAGQSVLFNHYLAQRMADGLLRQVLPGDVMARWPVGGLFVVADQAVEQVRCDNRETVPAGPMFGKKMYPATQAEAQIREAQVLVDAGLTQAAFHAFGKLLPGARRRILVYLEDLVAQQEAEGVRVTFTLPAGSYATVLLRELMHITIDEEEAIVDGEE